MAHSPELTAAVGLLAAVALLGIFGDNVAEALVAVVRAPLSETPVLVADPSAVVARLRHLALQVFWPLAPVLGGFAVAAVAAHQAQVGGLWVPGVLAPDARRLWTLGQGPGLGTRGVRGAWSLVKAGVVVAVAAWAIRSGWHDFQRLGTLETAALVRASGRAVWHLATMLAAATLALGVADFALQYQRFEAMLQTTPEEHREDQRSMEGDPALRARRRRLARSWRGDAPELLAGASLILTGPAGLTLVLAGGPPPRRVSLRTALNGPQGLKLRNSAEQAKVPKVEAPDLARRLAGRAGPMLPLPAEAIVELASIWPADERP